VDSTPEAEFESALRAGAYGAAWRYCCRLAGSIDAAQDLLQDSLAQALRQFATLRDRSAFRPWLLAIIRRQFLQQLRARRLAAPLEAELPGQVEAEPDADSELVAWGLRRLPAAQRELLELFYIEGLSLAELGQVLHVPAVAARHRLHRAREALRRLVQRCAAPLAGVQPREELE
jgi:RNA polymerase sigma-70 factor (ECF subfamily)